MDHILFLIAMFSRQVSRSITKTLSKGNNGNPLLFLTIQSKTYATDANHSIIKGEDKPIENTIGYVLSLNARNNPYANALRSVHQKFNWSFNTLKRHVEAFACGVIEVGLRPGDRLGMIQGVNAENLVALLGCAKVGASLVQFPEVKNAKDLTRFIELFRPRVLMLPLKIGKVNYLNILRETIPEFEKGLFSVPVRSKRFPFLKQILLTDPKEDPQEGTLRFKDILVYGPFGYYENPLRRLALNIDKETPAIVLMDGNDPNKATPYVLSHKNLLTAGTALAAKLGLQQGDRVLIPKYLTSPFGSVLGNFAAFTSGATIVYPKEEYEASTLLQTVALEKCSILFVQSSDMLEILNVSDVSNLELGSLRAVVTDDAVSDVHLSTLKSLLPNAAIFKISQLTPTSGLIAIDGDVVGNVEVKVTRPEDSKIVHRDTFGDLKIRGDLVARGYWNDIGLMNLDIDEDGWLNTGKIAKINKDGKIMLK
jgi:fatty-acyl-CoA synthase